MKKYKIVGLSALIVAAAMSLLLVRQRSLEPESSGAPTAAIVPAKSPLEQTTSAVAETGDAELERRREHSELLRLRGELARLRRELAEATAKNANPTSDSVTSAELERPAEAVETFVANADAVVPAGRGLIFGGWPTPPGKCTVVIVQPKVLEISSPGRVGSVMLEGKFVEIPDDALASAGLQKLKASARATSIQSLLTADEMNSLLGTLEKIAGVNILSAPRIQTGDGVQAVLSVTERKMIAGQEHALGPSLDVDPRIAADGSSVMLTVSARLKKPSGLE